MTTVTGSPYAIHLVRFEDQILLSAQVTTPSTKTVKIRLGKWNNYSTSQLILGGEYLFELDHMDTPGRLVY